MYGLGYVLLPFMGYVLIEAFRAYGFLGKGHWHSINGGQMNPYFQGSRGSINDLKFLSDQETSYPIFPM